MSQATPTKVTIEFDDGSQAEAYFDKLPMPLQTEILRQPFASKASEEPEKENYVLLEWNDGWKEVLEVDRACTEINRYYVISRPEDVGRLSLNREDGYPQLVEIVRRPMELKNVTFVESLELSVEVSNREGKKVDHFFALKKKGDGFAEVVEACKQALAEKAIDPQTIDEHPPERREDAYKRIARQMGIRAASRQQDLFDFIAYLVKAAR
jgi:hypothetical protein